MRTLYPRHVRIRGLVPGKARSVSISGSDGDQAALLLEAAQRGGIVLASELKGLLGFRASTVGRSPRDRSVSGIRIYV